MTSAFPEAMVPGYAHCLLLCTNYPKDRHVLAAAIATKTHTIVTDNLKDFPTTALVPHGVVATHPSDDLTTLFEHNPGLVVGRLHERAMGTGRSFEVLLTIHERTVPGFVDRVREELGTRPQL